LAAATKAAAGTREVGMCGLFLGKVGRAGSGLHPKAKTTAPKRFCLECKLRN